MKNRIYTTMIAAVTATIISLPAVAHDTGAMSGHGQMNQGMMTQGQMRMGQMPMGQMPMPRTQMMNQGMMMQPHMTQHMMNHMSGRHGGHAMQQGAAMMGGGYGIKAERELDVESVRKVLTGRLAWTGNTRLKVGKVEEKDDETVLAEIVTQGGSLVDRLAVHRRTGAMRRLP